MVPRAAWPCLERTLRVALIFDPSFLPDVPDAFAEPARAHYFLLGVKLNAFAALDVQVAKKGFVPAREWKHRHRRRNTDVDPDHPRLDAMLELARCLAGIGENCRAISKRGSVRLLDGVIEVV